MNCITAFKRGLRLEIRAAVIPYKTQNYGELLEIAMDMEKEICSYPSTNESLPTAKIKAMTKLEEVIFCQWCLRRGHESRECWQLVGRPNQAQNTNNNMPSNQVKSSRPFNNQNPVNNRTNFPNSNQQIQYRPTNNYPSANNSSENTFCRYGKSYGHNIDQCVIRQENNERRKRREIHHQQQNYNFNQSNNHPPIQHNYREDYYLNPQPQDRSNNSPPQQPSTNFFMNSGNGGSPPATRHPVA